MAGGAFGSCIDLHATWEEGEDAFGNPEVTFTSNVAGQEPVSICLNPLKGALVNGEVQTIANGLLILDDLFGSGVVSSDGSTYTITFPNQDSQEICLNPVKEVTQGDDGVITITYADDSTEEIEPSYAEDNGDGTTTTYHPDGSEHTTFDSPVLTINGVGPDGNGNVNPADLFSTTVDNGDGTFTTINSDGTPITWSGDTFASQSDNGDGTATIKFNDGSTLTVATGSPVTAVDNGDGTCTITIGSKQITVDSSPKDCVLTINGESPDADGDIEIEGDTVTDNGDDTYTVTPGDGSAPYDIDARCKKYINLAIEPCPIVFPICGSSASGDLAFTSVAEIDAWLQQKYSGELTFDPATCVISGCILADVTFDLEIVPASSDVEMSAQGGDLGFDFITTNDGSGFTVTWPDGSTGSFASDQAFSVTGQPVGSAVIRLDNPCAKITRINTVLGTWNYSIVDLFDRVPMLEFYRNIGQNTTSGDLAAAFANVPNLTLYNNQGQNTTSGDLAAAFANVPNLTSYLNQGFNTTSGDLAAAFANVPNLDYYLNQGFNTTSGDLAAAFANVPNLEFYRNQGQNTTSGDLVAAFANVPNLEFYLNQGQNTTSGDLVAAFANVPNLTSYNNIGQNTTSGDLAAAFANVPNLTLYNNQGQNTTSGDLAAAFANVPNLTSYLNQGFNTTSGDLAAAFANVPNLDYYLNQGFNTTSVSAVIPVNTTFRYFLQQGVGSTTAEIDFMLQSLANVSSWIVEKDVFIAGNNAPPSASGSSFITTILANGADQVVTN